MTDPDEFECPHVCCGGTTGSCWHRVSPEWCSDCCYPDDEDAA